MSYFAGDGCGFFGEYWLIILVLFILLVIIFDGFGRCGGVV